MFFLFIVAHHNFEDFIENNLNDTEHSEINETGVGKRAKFTVTLLTEDCEIYKNNKKRRKLRTIHESWLQRCQC